MDLLVNITEDLVLNNPVMNASGTFAYGREFSEIFDLSIMGGLIPKALSLKPRQGNPPPRIVEAPCGIINAIGLENIGVDAFLETELPFLKGFNVPIIANFFGESVEEYVECALRLDVEGIDGLEMNVSCPNVASGGLEFGRDKGVLSSLVSEIRKRTAKTLIVKLPPIGGDIVELALVAQESGADALTCANTFPAMAIDEETWRPILANTVGGLSGPAIKPIALRFVWEVHKKVKIPIIASGGVSSYRDVIQFLLAGASAVQVGSASLRDPLCFKEIIDGLKDYMVSRNIASVKDIVGKL